MNLEDIKHEGEQEGIRRAINSIEFNIRKLSEGLHWQNKKWRTNIVQIKKHLEELTVLFNSLDK